MRVDRIMSRDVVTVPLSAGLEDAARLMKEHDIRHLPVVENGRLAGLVTERDVRGAIFPAMLEEIGVADLMISHPTTVSADTLLEDAARIVYRNKIGCLPVINGDRQILGIVTVADMLAALIELMGFISASSRLDVMLPETPSALENACRIIQQNGGRITGISLTSHRGEQPTHLFRLQKTTLDTIVTEMDKAGYKIISSLS